MANRITGDRDCRGAGNGSLPSRRTPDPGEPDGSSDVAAGATANGNALDSSDDCSVERYVARRRIKRGLDLSRSQNPLADDGSPAGLSTPDSPKWRKLNTLTTRRRTARLSDGNGDTSSGRYSDNEVEWEESPIATSSLGAQRDTDTSVHIFPVVLPGHPSPVLPVFLRREQSPATPADLFDLAKRNIRIDSTCYSCSHACYDKGSKKTVIRKVFMCAMVRVQRGWISRPSYRAEKRGSKAARKAPPESDIAGKSSKKLGERKGKTAAAQKNVVLQRCTGKLVGYFRKQDYYFRQHGTAFHSCKLEHSGRRGDLDSRPPFLTISAAPSWGITDPVLMQMKASLQECPESWWTPLPRQAHTRHWLQRMGEADTQLQHFMRSKIESLLMPYFKFIQTIYPEMLYWKVGALRTQGNAPSQYQLWSNSLHTDYSEAVLSRPPRERPISVIMALDAFSFFKRPSVLDGAGVPEYDEVTVRKGQAIAFTSSQLHAGGPNTMKVPVYRLFAYMVSNKADFPAGEVYPDTIRRRAAASAARLHDDQLRHTTASGRPRKKVARY